MKYLIWWLLFNLMMYVVTSVIGVFSAARRATRFARRKLQERLHPLERNRWESFYSLFNPSGVRGMLKLLLLTPELDYRFHAGEANWKDELVLNTNLSDPVDVYKTVCLGKYLLDRETPVEFVTEEGKALGKWLNLKLNLCGLLFPYKLPRILAYKKYAVNLVSDAELLEKIVKDFEARMQENTQN